MTNIDTFLAVSKDYFGKGLQPLDILILAQAEEFNRNNRECYLTNQQLSDMFGATIYAVKTSLDRLEEKKCITRKTSYVEGNGRSNKQRVIKVTNKSLQFDNDDNGRLIDNLPNDNGRLIDNLPNDNGRLKSEEWKVDSRPIKEKEKENLSKRKDGADAPEKNRKENAKLLEDFSKQELWAIQDDFKDEVEYKELHNKYGIDWKYLNRNLGNNIQNILNNIKKEEIAKQVFDEFEYMPVYLTPEERDARFLRSRALRKAKEENSDDKAMTAW